MAVAVPVVRVARTTLDGVTWTPIIAPIDCNSVSIINADAAGNAVSVTLKLRTDDADANTEFRIGPGQQAQLAGPFTPPHNYGGRFRFLTGQTVILAQLSSGSYAVAQTFF